MLNRLLISLSIICLVIACGNENSSGSTVLPEYGESSSSVEMKYSSSAEGSSSKKEDQSSSSVENFSSEMPDESSSSVESSSSKKEDRSSSSVENSSSEMPDESSSSVESSSSKKGDRSSSSVESSSSETSDESSSSVESSSSKKEDRSSSSVESSSSVSSSSALKSIYDAGNNTLTDLRDGHVYKTTTIGLQVWMAENLNYLPEDTVGTYFAGRSVCGGGEYLSLQDGDCSVYGRLYDNIINAYDGFNKDVCPDGWSVPTFKQWQVLIESVGGKRYAGKMMKSTGKSYWSGDDLADLFGFSALPAGYFRERKGYNARDNEPMAVFTVHSLNSTERNGVEIYDTRDSTNFCQYGSFYYLAIRCVKD